MVAGLEPERHRDHQCRRRLRGLLARRGGRGRASSPSACTPPADFTAIECSPGDRARRIRHALHPQVSARRAGDHAQGRRRAQHRQRPRRGERGRAPPAHRSMTSRQGSRISAPCPAGCSSRRGCATAGSSTIPTTPIRVRCAPASRCCARSRASRGWCSADMAELGEHASDSHAHMGRYARDCGVKRLFALRAAELARGRDLRLGRRVVRRRRCADPAPAGGAVARA